MPEKIFLRNNTFLSYFPHIPASIIFKITIELINYSISKKTVLEILNVSRYNITCYLKHIYKLESISESNKK